MESFLKKRVRKYFSKFFDLNLPLKIGNQEIEAPLSHPLRTLIPQLPDYNHNLGRLVSYLEKSGKPICLVDVGANIGDTVAYVRNYSHCPILCIEGSSLYFKKLQRNAASFKNVELAFALVTDGKNRGDLVINTQDNSGAPVAGNAVNAAPMQTMEEILAAHPDFANPSILKTDTDGFDTIILRSSEPILRKTGTVLFFEFDPYLIEKNGDNSWMFLKFLFDLGYRYFIFYDNTGELIAGFDAQLSYDVLPQITDYYSGRGMMKYMDIAAYPSHMEDAYKIALVQEQQHFAKRRSFASYALDK